MSKKTLEMMEVVAGYPSDVVALNWHEKLDENDVRSGLSLGERDIRAGKHDLRLLQSSCHSQKPDTRLLRLRNCRAAPASGATLDASQ